jgi:type II secretory pathway pseudopilin PulG
MLVVLAILAIVLGALTQLFVSASTAQVDMTQRFEAQQNARLALDTLRREIHCANDVTLSNLGSSGFATAAVKLGTYCPTSAAGNEVTWCTRAGSVGYDLWRYVGSVIVVNCAAPPPGVTGSIKSSYLKTNEVFGPYSAPGSGNLGTLHVVLPVDLTPSDGSQAYKLEDDIVLRNSPRL